MYQFELGVPARLSGARNGIQNAYQAMIAFLWHNDSWIPSRSGKDNEHGFMAIGRSVLEQAIGEKLSGEPLDPAPPTKSPSAVALGRLGGLKGGTARAAALSPRKRSAIAKKAARARWKDTP